MILEQTGKYRVETEDEAKELIEEARAQSQAKGYVLKKASYERKVKKSKGEVIAEGFLVTIVTSYAGFWEVIE